MNLVAAMVDQGLKQQKSRYTSWKSGTCRSSVEGETSVLKTSPLGASFVGGKREQAGVPTRARLPIPAVLEKLQ